MRDEELGGDSMGFVDAGVGGCVVDGVSLILLRLRVLKYPFARMIIYTDSLEGTTPAMLHGFFVGWPNRPAPETHLRLLEGSDHVVLALDDAGRVVGFITAISDGVLSAYIPLLEVLPEYQGRGIGGDLVRRMLEKLDGLYMIDLLCDAPLQPYYERHGMKPATGMLVRNYERQSGEG
jgi:GNAT superfamily N-acetyltransferase